VKDLQSATERVGRYQILDTIGSGPNGTVSRAKVFGVAGFERQFAVKRFTPELTVQTAHAQALSSAARSYGSLEHPRIARMSEFGVVSGTTFTAVEHVVGLDAMRMLTETKLAGVALAIGGALALVSQAARAVGYAHGRGLSHLGLSPTNVIVTIDGDVKVTDFGILAATMPARPLDTPRLASRIPYLAPEQLSGEATSAATDVFVLGVIATELVTGHRAYRGDTPQQIADAILAGPPAEPPLPRPIVRVLQRCLARSPFERFPDARALADALDAALRVAPVPGTRKDIGAQVKAIVDRLGELNEGNLSGMLSVPSPPPAPRDFDTVPSGQPVVGRGPMDTEPSPTVGPQQLAAHAAASTIPEIPKAFTTVPGLAPPPIPVPPGVMTGGAPPPSPTGSPTMLGVPGVKRSIPSVPSVIPSIIKRSDGSGERAMPRAPQSPAAPHPVVAKEPSAPIVADDMVLEADPTAPLEPPPPPSPSAPPPPPAPPAPPAPMFADRPRSPTPGVNFDSTTGEMSRNQLEELNRLAIAPSGEHPPLERPATDAATSPTHRSYDHAIASFSPAHAISSQGPQPVADAPPQSLSSPEFYTPPPADPPPDFAPPPPSDYAPPPSDYAPPPSDYAPPPSYSPHTPQPFPASAYPPADRPVTTLPSAPPPPPMFPSANLPRLRTSQVRTRSRWPWVLFTLLLLGGLGAAGWFAYLQLNKDKSTTKVVMTTGSGSTTGSSSTGSNETIGSAGSSGSAVSTGSGTGSAKIATAPADAAEVAVAPPADAAQVAVTPPADAAVKAAPVDAGKTVVAATGTSDALEIASTPTGAHVFLDGADQGKTPLKLPGTADRHNVSLLLPGHELYVGEVDGHGKFDIAMKPVTPHGGPAGIKVLKCKDKDRYYVFVDGKPTGMTCPTERINVELGPHTVEVYDAVSESRQKWDIKITDTRLSFRVRIDEK
jgi:serine/threonine-protein kinase